MDLQAVRLMLVTALLITLPSAGSASPPQTCHTTFDAVARIRGELFFFKDDYFWRLSRSGHLMAPGPVEVGTFWEGLPQRSDISAAYQRPDGSMVFFCGRHYWVFWERRAKPGYPRPLSDLGLPEELAAVDAAFVSEHNDATYLIAGDMYWRFDDRTEQVEADYPQPLSRLCRGLPRRVDAAFSDNDGRTFFIQGRHYWRCDLRNGRVQSYAPDLVAPRWLGCSLAECCLDDLSDEVETRVHSVQNTGWQRQASRQEEADKSGRDAAHPTAGPAAALVAATAAAALWRGL